MLAGKLNKQTKSVRLKKQVKASRVVFRGEAMPRRFGSQSGESADTSKISLNIKANVEQALRQT